MYAHHPSIDATSYRESYVKLMDVSTCEQWGQMMQHIPSADHFACDNVVVRMGSKHITGLSFFRDGVTPEWEHPHNVGGTTLASQLRLDSHAIKSLWIDTLCDCARGAMDDGVVGVHLVQKWHVVRQAPVLRLDVWFVRGADVSSVCKAYPSLKFIRVSRHSV